jgi:hypothetical protein
MLNKCLLTGAMCTIAPGTPLQLLVAVFVCLCYLLAIVYASPFKGKLEDYLATITSLCLLVSLILGLTIIMDDDPLDKNFDINTLGLILVALNTVPLVGLVVFIVQICVYGPHVMLVEASEMGRSINFLDSKKGRRKGANLSKTNLQSQHHYMKKRSLSLDQVRTVVVHEKVNAFQLQHAEHHANALERIEERQHLAKARVALRVKNRQEGKGGGGKGGKHGKHGKHGVHHKKTKTKKNKTAVLPAASMEETIETKETKQQRNVVEPLNNLNLESNPMSVESIKQCLRGVSQNPKRLEKLVTKLLTTIGSSKDLSNSGDDGLSFQEFETFIKMCCTKQFHAMPSVETIRDVWKSVLQEGGGGDGGGVLSLKALERWLF